MVINQSNIYYFSGTGNSLKLSKTCLSTLSDLCIQATIEPIPTQANRSKFMITHADAIATADLLIFIAPVYALDMPRLMRAFIEAMPPARAHQKAIVIANGGDWDDAGWAVTHQAQTLRDKGYEVPLADVVMMPNNWIPMMDAPQGDEARQIRSEGETYLCTQLNKVLIDHQTYEKPFNTNNYGPVFSPLLHGLFHRMGIHFLWKRFKVTNSCTSCGYCAKNCPAGALTMVNGRPKWNKACEQCVRCMNLCPVRAIEQLESIGHGSKRPVYVEPGLRAHLVKGSD